MKSSSPHAPRKLPHGSRPGSTKHRGRIAQLVDQQQAEGRYIVTAADLTKLGLSTSAKLAALRRLVHVGRLAKVGHRRGLWLIVPLEYKAVGAPPAVWVLHDIMAAFGIPYYLALRSAAEWYGATHHAVQVLQVVVGHQLRPMLIGRQRVRFVLRTNIDVVPTRMLPGQVAPLRCSTPEATAIDLVRFMAISGGLTTITGVLQQIHPQLTPTGLRQALEAMADVPNVQRLGYLLTLIGDSRTAAICQGWLATRSPRVVRLEHGTRVAEPGTTPVDHLWKVAVNANPDLTL